MSNTKYFCDLNALSQKERERYQEFETLLASKVQSIEEEAEGYLLSFPMDPETFQLAAEFVTYERRCCPFLSFSLSAKSGEENGSLSISGPADAKPFIQAELGLAS